MTRASIGYNGATAGRRCGRRRGKRDLGVLDSEVIVVCAPLLRVAAQKVALDERREPSHRRDHRVGTLLRHKMARVVEQGDLRPMQGNAEAMADLKRILAAREPLYSKADATLDTSGETPPSSLARLRQLVHP